jgi:hypothetical protein
MRIYFPTWLDSLRGYAWAGGLGVVYTTDGGITWTVGTDGVTIGFFGGLIHVTLTTTSVTVTDGIFGYVLGGVNFRTASQDLRGAHMNAEFSFSLVDAVGTKATALMYATLPAGATLTQAQADFVALGAALDGVTGAQIRNGQMRVNFPADGAWKASPDADSLVEQTATFNIGVAENTRRWGINVPAIKDALLGVGDAVLVANAAVIAFTKAVDGTTALTIGNVANAAFQVATSAIDVVTAFRKHRKQLSRSSFEIIPAADR